MGIRINGVPVQDHHVYMALWEVSLFPDRYGISDLRVGLMQENGETVPDVDFNSEQVLQILNPDRPAARAIDSADMRSRLLQPCSRLSYDEFAGLAQEFARRFPAVLRQRRITLHHDVAQFELPDFRYSTHREHVRVEERAEAGWLFGSSGLEQASRLRDLYDMQRRRLQECSNPPEPPTAR